MKRLVKKLIPDFLLSFYHYCWTLIAAFFYGFPAKKLIVIGVTGTSGKSTVVELSSLILEQAGFKVASLSSIKFKIGNKEKENRLKMTMPGRMKIQKFLKEAVKADCKYAILEVTSEGIKQHRHRFIDFDLALFTNLSPEHIESHKSFDKYKGAKLRLFKATPGIHIINIDDKNSADFWKLPAEQKISYSLNEGAKLLPEKLNLLGEFNLYNALGATKIALSQGVSLDICKKVLEKAKGIPGRMEVVIKEPFTVIVDYAHTPEALEQVYKTLKDKRLICVLGSCGGGRDKWKRPVLGKLAAQYCNQAIITNEDPYDEDPMEIINQVAGNTKGEKILDRKQAIKRAIQLAHPNDVVIITGKGSEPWMCVKRGKKIPWDDRKITKSIFKELSSLN